MAGYKKQVVFPGCTGFTISLHLSPRKVRNDHQDKAGSKFLITPRSAFRANLRRDKVYLIGCQDRPCLISKLTSTQALPERQLAAMNNEQFRRLLADNKSTSKSGDKSGSSSRNAPAGGATPSAMLGSRMRSSIPMTPYVSKILRLQSV